MGGPWWQPAFSSFFFFCLLGKGSKPHTKGNPSPPNMSSEFRFTLMKPDALQGTPDEDLLAEMMLQEWLSAATSRHLTPEDVTALARVEEDPDKQEAAYSRLTSLMMQARHAAGAGRAVALNAHDVLVRHAGHRKVVTSVLRALNYTSAQGLGGMGGGLEGVHLSALAACAPRVVEALNAFGLEDVREHCRLLTSTRTTCSDIMPTVASCAVAHHPLLLTTPTLIVTDAGPGGG